ncbi:unnamed protein product [Gongylonema pulchrum]|uniref:AMP-binding domain-containing protein n=1 Tax=Gongylonema pulchrum TaxID=637853 RepID=A0A183EEU3_9BILA|nr:unnamed protein product [Gongylonema pulchrum]
MKAVERAIGSDEAGGVVQQDEGCQFLAIAPITFESGFFGFSCIAVLLPVAQYRIVSSTASTSICLQKNVVLFKVVDGWLYTAGGLDDLAGARALL